MVTMGHVVACLALVLSTACGVEEDIVCPQGIFPAIQVEIKDAATGDPAWWGARGSLSDGGYRDSLRAPSVTNLDSTMALLLYGGMGRPGTYTVVVQKNGFLEWQASDVVVASSGGPCSMVETVTLRADLERAP